LQAEEYMHAYHELGLTLGSGIYGATFFMLTGFHGAHVTIGTIILFVMLMRIMRGHFDAEHHFGFEAASWYWHFVDVVWIGCSSSFMCFEALYHGACDTSWPLKKPQAIKPTVITARAHATVKAMTRRLELLSSLTRKNRPLNRLATVAISIRTMAALSMGDSGGRDALSIAGDENFLARHEALSPGLAPTLVVALLLPLLVGLGFWQLGRGRKARCWTATPSAGWPSRWQHASCNAQPTRPFAACICMASSMPPQPAAGQPHARRQGRRRTAATLSRPGQRPVAAGQSRLAALAGSAQAAGVHHPRQALSLDAWVYVAPGATFQLHADPASTQWPHLLTALTRRALAELGRRVRLRTALKPGPVRTRPTGRWWPWARKNTWPTPCSGSPWRRPARPLPLPRLAQRKGETPWERP
jgi:hypothetical protein